MSPWYGTKSIFRFYKREVIIVPGFSGGDSNLKCKQKKHYEKGSLKLRLRIEGRRKLTPIQLKCQKYVNKPFSFFREYSSNLKFKIFNFIFWRAFSQRHVY